MSYDIHLEADLGGEEPVRVGDLEWNYTSNIGGIVAAAAEATGLRDLRDLEGLAAVEALVLVERLALELRRDPERYRALDPENGWGSLETFLPALDRLVDELRPVPRAIVKVWA